MRAPSSYRRLAAALFFATCLATANGSAQSEPALNGIVRTKSGFPLAGAHVTLFAEDRVRRTITNHKGEFEFRDLPEEAYELEAAFIGYRNAILPGIRTEDSNSKDLQVSLVPWSEKISDARAVPCPEIVIARVTGTYEPIVYDKSWRGSSLVGSVSSVGSLYSGHGTLKDVALRLIRSDDPSSTVASTKSKGTGEFEFDDVMPGKYFLKVSGDGYFDGSTPEFWITRENTTTIGLIGMWDLRSQDICSGTVLITEERDSIVPPAAIPPDPWPYPLTLVNPRQLRPLRRWRNASLRFTTWLTITDFDLTDRICDTMPGDLLQRRRS